MQDKKMCSSVHVQTWVEYHVGGDAVSGYETGEGTNFTENPNFIYLTYDRVYNLDHVLCQLSRVCNISLQSV